jgi:Raf kinase inhibitor-like YbhB/YbcL family protein
MQAIFTPRDYQDQKNSTMRRGAGGVRFSMQPQTETHKMPQTLRVSSPAFGTNGSIPADFTSDGQDVAPPLSWSSPPPGTKSIAILVEDPDAPDPAAPTRTWVHWIVSGIAPTETTLAGGDNLPPGAAQGINDWGQRRWMGPNPPVGRHRYFFRVYALDIALASPNMRKAELLSAMKGHILAEGELIGTYEKPPEFRSAQQGQERSQDRAPTDRSTAPEPGSTPGRH